MNLALFAFLTLLVFNVSGLPQPLFYEPTWFIQPPRLERPWLCTARFLARGGVNKEGYNSSHQEVNILDIYGAENIRLLAEGVPANQLGDNAFLNNLFLQTPGSSRFGTISWSGQFSIFNLFIEATQNLAYGFYLQALLPLRRWHFYNITYTDHSMPDEAGAIDFFAWRAFFNNLFSELESYNVLIKNNSQRSDLGDIQLLIGWTRNDEHFSYIDFWDYSLTTGVFIPTSKPLMANQPFYLSTGFDHHAAVPLSFNTALGLYDWFTIGFHATGYWFAKKVQERALKTAEAQNGWINLAKEQAQVKLGSIVYVGGYLAADHVVHGFSATLGFDFAHQQATKLTVLTNAELYNPFIVNSDIKLQSWSMLTMHWVFEYDFASHRHSGRPQLALVVDVPIQGKRVFKNKMLGVYVQGNYEW